jgi:hypothetical protein
MCKVFRQPVAGVGLLTGSEVDRFGQLPQRRGDLDYIGLLCCFKWFQMFW